MKTNNKLSDAEKISLFKLRVREIKVKANYKNMYVDFYESDRDQLVSWSKEMQGAIKDKHASLKPRRSNAGRQQSQK